MPLGAEERSFLKSRLLDVLGDGLTRSEVEPNPPVFIALLVQGDGRLVPVLVEVFYFEPAGGADSSPGVEEEFDDGPIPVVEDRITRGEPHQLSGPGRRECLGLIARVRRPP